MSELSASSWGAAPSPAQVEKQHAIDHVQSVQDAIEQAFEMATEEEGIVREVGAAAKARRKRMRPGREPNNG